jgi:hypothetical protein
MREAICSRICSHPLSFLHLFEINNFGQTYEFRREKKENRKVRKYFSANLCAVLAFSAVILFLKNPTEKSGFNYSAILYTAS